MRQHATQPFASAAVQCQVPIRPVHTQQSHSALYCDHCPLMSSLKKAHGVLWCVAGHPPQMEAAADHIDGRHAADADLVQQLVRWVDVSDSIYPDRFSLLVHEQGVVKVRHGAPAQGQGQTSASSTRGVVMMRPGDVTACHAVALPPHQPSAARHAVLVALACCPPPCHPPRSHPSCTGTRTSTSYARGTTWRVTMTRASCCGCCVAPTTSMTCSPTWRGWPRRCLGRRAARATGACGKLPRGCWRSR